MQAFEKAQQMYASYGITTIQEGMLVEELAELYRPLLDNKLLWLDVVGYGDLKTAESLKKKFSQHIGQYKDHFRFGGYKIFLDGSPQGKTAWMLHPYKNAEDGYCGYPTMTNQQVKDAVALAVGDNMQILAHCNGDAAAAVRLIKSKDILLHQTETISFGDLPGIAAGAVGRNCRAFPGPSMGRGAQQPFSIASAAAEEDDGRRKRTFYKNFAVHRFSGFEIFCFDV